ncbi:uncharacterized protein LOC124379221 isoform X5 [Silurus meridionalis]|uniref:uncharacterized protein LOC124379221 isoform X5 n=1 Tax=Silurus meridionalis TaxID=175797 RepID=UPI001EEA4862|nr:uncharacterized protein LOC124379221 isoform X5 [Silurus meridionalis]
MSIFSYKLGNALQWISDKTKQKTETLNCFCIRTGKTLNSDAALIELLKKKIPADLQEVDTVEECDFILVFCPVIRGLEIDFNAALKNLNQYPDTKHAVLVMLHHTFDPEFTVPGSVRVGNRENTIVVHCLFYEDEGLLKCGRNKESLDTIINYIKPQIFWKNKSSEGTDADQSSSLWKHNSASASENVHSASSSSSHHQNYDTHGQNETETLKCFTIRPGKTLNSDAALIELLKKKIPADLQEVETVEECDFILVFCHVIRGLEIDFNAALKNLNQYPDTKHAVLVMLHHTFDPEFTVPGSVRVGNRENTIVVHCLFYEDEGLLKCGRNKESLDTIINYIKPQIFQKNKSSEGTDADQSSSLWKHSESSAHLHYIYLCDDDEQFINSTYSASASENVHSASSSSRHHQNSASSSSRHHQNYDTHGQNETETLKCFTIRTGKTLNSDAALIELLKKKIPADLQEVDTVEECDFILVFCPVIRGLEIDFNAALKNLNQYPDTKRAVLVMLHHTFDPEFAITGSVRAVNRENTIVVHCLFYEDEGLLKCGRNKESLDTIINYIKPQIFQKNKSSEGTDADQSSSLWKHNSASASENVNSASSSSRQHQNSASSSSRHHQKYDTHGQNVSPKGKDQKKKQKKSHAEKTLKYFILEAGKTLNAQEMFMSKLKLQIPLQEVCTAHECDMILAFCPVVSRAGTDIEAAQKKINDKSADKPAFLIVLHYTFDSEGPVPESSRIVNRKNTITFDCLFYENHGFLQCHKNHSSFSRIIQAIQSQFNVKLMTEENMEIDGPAHVESHTAKKIHKFFAYQQQNITQETFIAKLEKSGYLKEVETENECNVIVTFMSREGTDIKRARTDPETVSDGPSQSPDKQENVENNAEAHKNDQTLMEIKNHDEEKQLEKAELEKQKAELAEKSKQLEEKESCLNKERVSYCIGTARLKSTKVREMKLWESSKLSWIIHKTIKREKKGTGLCEQNAGGENRRG